MSEKLHNNQCRQRGLLTLPPSQFGQRVSETRVMRMKPEVCYFLFWFSAAAVFVSGQAFADKPAGLSPQSLTVPSGPTSLKGLGESFSPNIATGTGSYSVPLDVPPGFLAPSLALSYSSGSGKSEVGVGFGLIRSMRAKV